MNLAILSFVNLSRSDAYLSVEDASGELQFVAKILPGTVSRQATAVGLKWNVIASDSYSINADDKNQVYLIGSNGVYAVSGATALTAESGAKPTDAEFPIWIGGGGGGGAPVS